MQAFRRAIAAWAAGAGLALALGLSPAAAQQELPGAPDPSPEEEALLDFLATPWTGDLPGIVERGFLRVGVAYNPILYSYDGPTAKGLTVDAMVELEAHLRKSLGAPASRLTVVMAPLPRDRLFPALTLGHVDMLAANLTVTPDRAAMVDFTDPFVDTVAELVVTGPAAPDVASFDDLVRHGVQIRRSSSYFEHLSALNAARAAEGKAVIPITEAPEELEDNDLLELVAVGTIPAVIVDSHKAQLWVQIFEGLTIHEDLAVASDQKIAWAVRKDSPELKAALNGFVKKAKAGTLLGNTLLKRYFADPDRIANALEPRSSERFRGIYGYIRAHAAAYDFEPLLIAAQGYQESRLDQSKRSPVGAIGVMQVMPRTATDPNVGIPDIHVAERNVEAGIKYLRFLRDHYFDDPAIAPLDRMLLTFAAYNAGPGNISKARKRAVKMGLDPNVWFGNVEIATAKAVSREPVVYVRNIMKYYVAYKLATAQQGG